MWRLCGSDCDTKDNIGCSESSDVCVCACRCSFQVIFIICSSERASECGEETKHLLKLHIIVAAGETLPIHAAQQGARVVETERCAIQMRFISIPFDCISTWSKFLIDCGTSHEKFTKSVLVSTGSMASSENWFAGYYIYRNIIASKKNQRIMVQLNSVAMHSIDATESKPFISFIEDVSIIKPQLKISCLQRKTFISLAFHVNYCNSLLFFRLVFSTLQIVSHHIQRQMQYTLSPKYTCKWYQR